MVGPNNLFFGDTGLQVYQHHKGNPSVENTILYKAVGPEKLDAINNYLKYFNLIYLKDEIVSKLKEDFLFFTDKLGITDTKDYIRCSFLVRTNTADVETIDIFGSSIFIPMLHIDTELPVLLFKYDEHKVLKYTGMGFDDFIKKTKTEQDILLNTLVKIEEQDKAKLSSVVDDLEILEEGKN